MGASSLQTIQVLVKKKRIYFTVLSVLQCISSSYGFLVHFLVIVSCNWGFKIIIVCGVGLLCLRPTPNLEDQDFILQFTPLEGLACA
jgi:hypothetical protein